jgi:hypothetical protein
MPAREVNAAGAVVRLRRPGAVALLSLLPVYWFVWYYRVNREMRDYGRQRRDAELAKVKPWAAVITALVGNVLLIPLCISLWRTVRRVGRSERAFGLQPEANTVFAVLLTCTCAATIASAAVTDTVVGLAVGLGGLLALLTFTALVQRRLNALWGRFPATTPESAASVPLRSDITAGSPVSGL